MEITIYDKKGNPCAYIATDDDHTIYLFNGQPVAYIAGENIYGFNGKHLGWFKRRVTYDRNGLRIGFTKIICPSPTQVEPKKSAKKVKPVKSAKKLHLRNLIFSLVNQKIIYQIFYKANVKRI